MRNRIVMAPMTVDYANPDETPSEKQIAYYAERAKAVRFDHAGSLHRRCRPPLSGKITGLVC
ncbi:MAG: hypothetical protein IPK95_04105 [Cellvibrionales bacterium]|nr:hypothetical protein [Cellvibrionales bacterium]